MKREKPWNLHIPGAALDAELVLMDSAQVFHWVKTQSGLSAVCAGRAVTLMRSGEDWLLKGAAPSDAAFWKRYFCLLYTSTPFGRLPGGEEAFLYTMTNARGESVSITNYGGIVTAVRVLDLSLIHI